MMPDTISTHFGYTEFRSHTPETGYFLNFTASSTSQCISFRLYFISNTCDKKFYVDIPYRPSFLIDAHEDSLQAMEDILQKEYGDVIDEIQIVYRTNPLHPNHLNKPPVCYLRVYFYAESGFRRTLSELRKIVKRHKQFYEVNIERDKQDDKKHVINKKMDVLSNDDANIYGNVLDDGVSMQGLMSLETLLKDVHEFDIPFDVSFLVEYNIRVGLYYKVVFKDKRYTIVPSEEIVPPLMMILAFDIETTKEPLKFPRPDKDEVMMISFMANEKGVLLTNREVVNDEIRDFEYKLEDRHETYFFQVYNCENEKSLLLKFIELVYVYKPDILTTYNGEYFDIPFLRKRIEVVFEDESIELNKVFDSIMHLDCFKWVKRDSYLPMGSQGLKAVTKAKLGYFPEEIDPEEMMWCAQNDGRRLGVYSVSDSVATYNLYIKYVHPFIFSLCTLIPMNAENVLSRGSGTLCEALLIAESKRKSILVPLKKMGDDVYYKGRMCEDVSYVGGHVECLRSGIYRSDFEYDFKILGKRLDEIEGLIEEVLKEEGIEDIDDTKKVILNDILKLKESSINKKTNSSINKISLKDIADDKKECYKNIDCINKISLKDIADDKKECYKNDDCINKISLKDIADDKKECYKNDDCINKISHIDIADDKKVLHKANNLQRIDGNELNKNNNDNCIENNNIYECNYINNNYSTHEYINCIDKNFNICEKNNCINKEENYKNNNHVSKNDSHINKEEHYKNNNHITNEKKKETKPIYYDIKTKPKIYHLDVAAMYPNIILTNRLQPISVINQDTCIKCDFYTEDNNCQRKMKWEMRVQYLPPKREEVAMIKRQLIGEKISKKELEKVEYFENNNRMYKDKGYLKKPEVSGNIKNTDYKKSGIFKRTMNNNLNSTKKNCEDGIEYEKIGMENRKKILKERVFNYSKQVYKRTNKIEVIEMENIVCQREIPFYVDVVRNFRDKRYEYKRKFGDIKKKIDALNKNLSQKKENYDNKPIKEENEIMNDGCSKNISQKNKDFNYKSTKRDDEIMNEGIEELNKKLIIYESLQIAHKCILNSFYGYVMRKGARWYSMEMAAIVCNTGASIIKLAKDLIDDIGIPLELDTDGIWCLVPDIFPDTYICKNGKKISFLCSLLNLLVKKRFTNDQYQNLKFNRNHNKDKACETTIVKDIEFEIDGPYKNKDHIEDTVYQTTGVNSIKFEIDGPHKNKDHIEDTIYETTIVKDIEFDIDGPCKNKDPMEDKVYETTSVNSIKFEIDGPYKAMILPASTEEGKLIKKKYVVINKDGKISELKGFETKRRGELQIIKKFQEELFQLFNSGDTLKACYGSIKELCEYWLGIIRNKGECLNDNDIFELFSESKNMSKEFKMYLGRKTTSTTTAKRLSEILGDNILKESGLKCQYIIVKYPINEPVANRAVPVEAFMIEDKERNKILTKWMKHNYGMETELKSILDWEYYKERLESVILKVVVLPGILQGMGKVVDGIKVPEWAEVKKSMKLMDFNIKKRVIENQNITDNRNSITEKNKKDDIKEYMINDYKNNIAEKNKKDDIKECMIDDYKNNITEKNKNDGTKECMIDDYKNNITEESEKYHKKIDNNALINTDKVKENTIDMNSNIITKEIENNTTINMDKIKEYTTDMNSNFTTKEIENNALINTDKVKENTIDMNSNIITKEIENNALINTDKVKENTIDMNSNIITKEIENNALINTDKVKENTIDMNSYIITKEIENNTPINTDKIYNFDKMDFKFINYKKYVKNNIEKWKSIVKNIRNPFYIKVSENKIFYIEGCTIKEKEIKNNLVFYLEFNNNFEKYENEFSKCDLFTLISNKSYIVNNTSTILYKIEIENEIYVQRFNDLYRFLNHLAVKRYFNGNNLYEKIFAYQSRKIKNSSNNYHENKNIVYECNKNMNNIDECNKNSNIQNNYRHRNKNIVNDEGIKNAKIIDECNKNSNIEKNYRYKNKNSNAENMNNVNEGIKKAKIIDECNKNSNIANNYMQNTTGRYNNSNELYQTNILFSFQYNKKNYYVLSSNKNTKIITEDKSQSEHQNFIFGTLKNYIRKVNNKKNIYFITKNDLMIDSISSTFQEKNILFQVLDIKIKRYFDAFKYIIRKNMDIIKIFENKIQRNKIFSEISGIPFLNIQEFSVFQTLDFMYFKELHKNNVILNNNDCDIKEYDIIRDYHYEPGYYNTYSIEIEIMGSMVLGIIESTNLMKDNGLVDSHKKKEFIILKEMIKRTIIEYVNKEKTGINGSMNENCNKFKDNNILEKEKTGIKESVNINYTIINKEKAGIKDTMNNNYNKYKNHNILNKEKTDIRESTNGNHNNFKDNNNVLNIDERNKFNDYDNNTESNIYSEIIGSINEWIKRESKIINIETRLISKMLQKKFIFLIINKIKSYGCKILYFNKEIINISTEKKSKKGAIEMFNYIMENIQRETGFELVKFRINRIYKKIVFLDFCNYFFILENKNEVSCHEENVRDRSSISNKKNHENSEIKYDTRNNKDCFIQEMNDYNQFCNNNIETHDEIDKINEFNTDKKENNYDHVIETLNKANVDTNKEDHNHIFSNSNSRVNKSFLYLFFQNKLENNYLYDMVIKNKSENFEGIKIMLRILETTKNIDDLRSSCFKIMEINEFKDECDKKIAIEIFCKKCGFENNMIVELDKISRCIKCLSIFDDENIEKCTIKFLQNKIQSKSQTCNKCKRGRENRIFDFCKCGGIYISENIKDDVDFLIQAIKNEITRKSLIYYTKNYL